MYELKPENGKGRTRIMHWNLLLTCDFLPVEPIEDDRPVRQKRRTVEPREENLPVKPRRERKKTRNQEQDSSSEDEDDWRGIVGRPSVRASEWIQSQLRAEALEFYVKDKEEEGPNEEDMEQPVTMEDNDTATEENGETSELDQEDDFLFYECIGL